MPAPPHPFEGSSFTVEVDGQAGTSFSRVEIPHAVVDEVAHRSGSDRSSSSHLAPGLSHYSHLVLTRGLTSNLDLWTWWRAARDGDPSVDRNVRVRLLDAAGAPVMVWTFQNAFPVVHRLTPLDTSSTEAVLETVELAFDSMDAEA
jgi:phage tail-like protein